MSELWQRKSDGALLEVEEAPIARGHDGQRLFRIKKPGRIQWSYYHPSAFHQYFQRPPKEISCETSPNPASILGNEEGECHSVVRGRLSPEDVARERQAFANRSARHYQRLGLAFPDLLALFRLAGKAYDRGLR